MIKVLIRSIIGRFVSKRFTFEEVLGLLTANGVPNPAKDFRLNMKFTPKTVTATLTHDEFEDFTVSVRKTVENGKGGKATAKAITEAYKALFGELFDYNDGFEFDLKENKWKRV